MKKLLMVLILSIICLGVYGQNIWDVPFVINSTCHVYVLDMVKHNGQNYILYTEENDYGQNYLYVNVINNNGLNLINQPVKISEVIQTSSLGKILISSEGNLIIVWNQLKADNSASLYSQKIDSSAHLLWPTKNLITDSFKFNYELNAISSLEGGAVVSWYDEDNLVQKFQIIDSHGSLVTGYEGKIIPGSQNSEYYDMIIKGDYINTLIYDHNNTCIKLHTINFRDTSEVINSYIIQNGIFYDKSIIKSVFKNNILTVVTGMDYVKLKLLDENYNNEGVHVFANEKAIGIEAVNDSIFVLLNKSANGCTLRKIDKYGAIIETLSINSDFNSYRLSNIVKYDNKIMFTINCNILLNDFIVLDETIIYNFLKNIIYDIDANTLSVNNQNESYYHSEHGNFTLRNSFISYSDSLSTSFIKHDPKGLNDYLYNTMNNNDFSYLFNDDIIIMKDKDYATIAYSSSAMNNKIYYISTRNKNILSCLDVNREYQELNTFNQYLRWTDHNIINVNNNLLLTINGSLGSNLPYTTFKESGAWIYNEDSGLSNLYESHLSLPEMFNNNIVTDADDNNFWIADNCSSYIKIARSLIDSLFNVDTMDNTRIKQTPLSINNGYLITKAEDELILYKFNPDYTMSDGWPYTGVVLNGNCGYPFSIEAEIFLTESGLLTIWTKSNVNSQTIVSLINQENGNIVWGPISLNISKSKSFNYRFINNMLYISYVDYNDLSLKLKCFSLEQNQLILQWTKTISNKQVKYHSVLLVDDRLFFAYSVKDINDNKIYMRSFGLNGYPDNNPNGFLVYDTNLICINPKLDYLGNNRAMLSFFGYHNPNYYNHYASLIDLNQFVENDDQTVSANPYNVYQNYPNPFNPSTSITFEIDKKSAVEISVYNVKGQKVRNLSDKVFEAGRQSVVWDGKDDDKKTVSSGIYFARVKNTEKSKTIKMLMVK